MVRATTVKGFEQKIRARMKQVGTYRPEFKLTMERLAKVYKRMLDTESQYNDEGCQILVEQIGSTGASKMVKNPLLVERTGKQHHRRQSGTGQPGQAGAGNGDRPGTDAGSAEESKRGRHADDKTGGERSAGDGDRSAEGGLIKWQRTERRQPHRARRRLTSM